MPQVVEAEAYLLAASSSELQPLRAGRSVLHQHVEHAGACHPAVLANTQSSVWTTVCCFPFPQKCGEKRRERNRSLDALLLGRPIFSRVHARRT